MKVPKIIALTGYKGSGKNAVAREISFRYGHKEIAFADALRERFVALLLDNIKGPEGSFSVPGDMPPEVDEAFIEAVSEFRTFWRNQGLPPLRECAKEYVYKKPTPPACRKALQFLGTEYYRAKDRAYWLKAMHLDPDQSYVITDLRFPNEAELVSLFGGAIIRVSEPNYKSEDPHESERHIRLIVSDYNLTNPKDGLENIPPRLKNALDYIYAMDGNEHIVFVNPTVRATNG